MTQNDQLLASWAAKTVPREPKTPSRQPKSLPKTLQRGPKSPQDDPKTPQGDPRPPQEPCWDGLGAILRPSDHKIENQVAAGKWWSGSWVDFGSQNGSQNDPKSTPKRVKNQDEKCITFLSLLDPSWTGLEAILGASWGHFWQFCIGFSNVFWLF